MIIALAILCGATTALAVFFGYRLYQWEKLLSRSRLKVWFKGKPAMTPRLLDLVEWSRLLQNDKAVNGQVIYKQGGTTLALTRAHKRVPKPRDKTIREGV